MLAPSQFPRNRITVAAWMAEMDRQRGARIRQLRDSRSIGREALAPKLGVSVKTLYNWEKGHEINPANLRALAKFFDVTIDYIRNGPLETPDLLGAKGDEWVVVGKLDEILARLDRLENYLTLESEQDSATLPPDVSHDDEGLLPADLDADEPPKPEAKPARRAG